MTKENVFSADYELGFLQEALQNFEPYLLSQAIQWPLGGHRFSGQPPFPPLTVENFLIARQRCQIGGLSPKQAVQLTQVERSFQVLVDRWRTALGKKASQGFHHRLNLWDQFLRNLIDDPHAQRDRYPYEVRLRVMLALLTPYADLVSPEEFQQVGVFDQKLRSLFHPGDFIWAPELKESFPSPIFWYLYGSPGPTPSLHENSHC